MATLHVKIRNLSLKYRQIWLQPTQTYGTRKNGSVNIKMYYRRKCVGFIK